MSKIKKIKTLEVKISDAIKNFKYFNKSTHGIFTLQLKSALTGDLIRIIKNHNGPIK